jgi:protein associated with RNAse G/E
MTDRSVQVEQRKWPDARHWHYDARWLGEDDHGAWLYVAPDTILQRGDEPERLCGVDMIVLIPRDTWWMVEFYPSGREPDVYVNIGSVPSWRGDTVHQIDLDLDVVRSSDGSVTIIDEDEFTEHQHTLGYPAEIILSARTAADTAAKRLAERTEPFGSASERWWRQAFV